LCFDQLAFAIEEFQPLAQFGLDRFDRAHDGVARRHVMRRRIDGKTRNFLTHPSGERVEELQRFDFVVE